LAGLHQKEFQTIQGKSRKVTRAGPDATPKQSARQLSLALKVPQTPELCLPTNAWASHDDRAGASCTATPEPSG
jgi:hypothetical protein